MTAGSASAFHSGPVTVEPAATSANLGPGFDSFGLALELRDEVSVEVTDRGLTVEVTGEGAAGLPCDESHLMVRALRAAFDALGGQPPGLRVTAHNRIPHGRGLGSSSAAICAGVVAARALVRAGESAMDDSALLGLATALEGHPDNVAPCLTGGLTVAWLDEAAGARVLRLDPVADLRPIVFIPPNPLATAVARGLLPAEVPHCDAAFNAGRAGLLTAALTVPGLSEHYRSGLLRAATQDRLHQEYRAPAMPDSALLIEQLRADGFAAVVSGAGPTVMVLTVGSGSVDRILAYAPTGWSAARLPVATAGVLLKSGDLSHSVQ
jgi:homoserine kinase